MNETGFEYLVDNDYATVWSSERKWINKIIKLKESHPKDVEIKYLPENNDGTIYAHVSKKWLKISPPRQVNMTDEQRAAAAKRLKSARGKINE